MGHSLSVCLCWPNDCNRLPNWNNLNYATFVQKHWNHCNVLRDDGMSYGDYVEQFICPSIPCLPDDSC